MLRNGHGLKYSFLLVADWSTAQPTDQTDLKMKPVPAMQRHALALGVLLVVPLPAMAASSTIYPRSIAAIFVCCLGLVVAVILWAMQKRHELKMEKIKKKQRGVTRAHMKTAILSSPMRSPTKVVLRSHNSSDMDSDLAGLDLAGDAGRDAGDIKSDELVTLPARPMSHTKKKVCASC
jgi:hypothetical protein